MVHTTSLINWLEALAAQGPSTRLAEKLHDALVQNPSRASYASISEISQLADLNLAAVTRTAQNWGFAGWPDLRVELRSRYLESLSLSEVASERRTNGASDHIAASLDADRRALISTSTDIDADGIRTVAAIAAGARHRVALGVGSYRSLADLVATYFSLAGYPTSSPSDTAGIVGSLAELSKGDLVIGFDLWRGYTSTLQALDLAREKGASVCLITDRGTRHPEGGVDHLFHVASESSAFFPTLVPAVALVNALATQLASIDPVVTETSTERFEQLWHQMGFDGRA